MDYAALKTQMEAELAECESNARKLRAAIAALAVLDGSPKPLSKQRRYQIARNERGLCEKCPQPIAPGSRSMCERHREMNREAGRKRYGSKPWAPGCAGRTPEEVMLAREVLQEA